MMDNEIDAFVDALLSERSPKEFAVTPEDSDVLRLAILLRAQRSEVVSPDPSFVDDLHRKLAASVSGGTKVVSLAERRRRIPRSFRLVGQAAAAAALVAGTFTATHLVDRQVAAPAVAKGQVAAGTVHSGVLLSAHGQAMGQAYAYAGSPSWVFMDVHGSNLSGVYICHLQLADGTSIPAGVVSVYNGTGDWAHTIKVPASEVRGATLEGSDGDVMARVTFS